MEAFPLKGEVVGVHLMEFSVLGSRFFCTVYNSSTVKFLIERCSKSASNSLNSLEAFPIMRHHLRVVVLFMRHRLI